EGVLTQDLTADSHRTFLIEYGTSNFDRQSFGQNVSKGLNGSINPLCVVAVGTPHNAVGRHDFQPLQQCTPSYVRTQDRQPDGIQPNIGMPIHHRTQYHGSRLMYPRKPSMKQDELSLGMIPDQLHQQERIGPF